MSSEAFVWNKKEEARLDKVLTNLATQELVTKAMENATENGYDFEAWTFTEAAQDLIEHNVDFETSTPEELKPLVKEWFLNSGVLYRMYDE